MFLIHKEPASTRNRHLVVRVTILEAGSEVVPASSPQESQADAPFKQNGVGRGVSNHNADVVGEVAFVRARQFQNVSGVIGCSTILPVEVGRRNHSVYHSLFDVDPFGRHFK